MSNQMRRSLLRAQRAALAQARRKEGEDRQGLGETGLMGGKRGEVEAAVRRRTCIGPTDAPLACEMRSVSATAAAAASAVTADGGN